MGVLTVEELRSSGRILSLEPKRVTINWKEQSPQTGDVESFSAEIWVIKPSYGMINQFVLENKEEMRDQWSAVISACVRLGEDANERIDLDSAYRLSHTLAKAMYDAVQDGGVVPKKPKRSPTRKNSGTN